MLPVLAVVAGKAVFDIVAGSLVAGGVISAINIAHDNGEKIGYHRGLEYRSQERNYLFRLAHQFQMGREAIKDRIHTLASPYAHIDICDPHFFSKSLAVLERNLPNWRGKMREES
ncbi:hypothetical protein FACS1894163_03890 [Spirochaetia bacterium]|nr:hypothetical protein FACS1894163_03890 [Spirochaetia bacterium]